MNRALFKYELFNVLRGRWLPFYALLYAGMTEAFLQFGTEPGKVVASLMSAVLLVIPMVSLLYSSIYWYNADGFTTLLLTQPMRRKWIYLARWVAISSALSGAFLAGTAAPLAAHRCLDASAGLLLALGLALTIVFVSIGLLISVRVPDRMRGIGAAFLAWFYFAIVHDGIVFLLMSLFHDYPLEVPSILLTAINPVDLARVSLLLSLDQSALMGYTGAILQKLLSGAWGLAVIPAAFALWITLPLALGTRRFLGRDY